MKYEIEYEETYGGIFEIEADSEEDAKTEFDMNFEYYSRKLWCNDSRMEIRECK